MLCIPPSIIMVTMGSETLSLVNMVQIRVSSSPLNSISIPSFSAVPGRECFIYNCVGCQNQSSSCRQNLPTLKLTIIKRKRKVKLGIFKRKVKALLTIIDKEVVSMVGVECSISLSWSFQSIIYHGLS